MVAPLERSPRTLDELLRQRAAQTPSAGLAAFPKSADASSYEVFTVGQLDAFAEVAAVHYAKTIPTRTRNSPEKVVALLGVSDLDYIVTQFALGRLGFTVLFLSNRLSAAAVASLIRATNCSTLVSAQGFELLTGSVQEICSEIGVVPLLQYSEYSTGVLTNAQLKFHKSDLDLDLESTMSCHIIHSSGSTGFPKPIRNIHKNFLHNVANNFNMNGFITLPLFHNHGISSFYRALTSGKILYFYNPRLPLSAKQLGSAFKHLGERLEIFFGVPYALKVLADTSDGVELLSKFRIVMFGGSSCPDDLGDRLVRGKVNLVSHYGATEVGQLMTSFRPAGDDEWNYVRPSPELLRSLQWVRHGDALECVVKDGWKSKVVSNQADGSYATRDLFVQHPTKSDRFKYVGRLDDWIVLVNGEKINPVQYEHTIRTSSYVAEAVVFGIGKVAAGLIIIPNQGYENIPEDKYLDLVKSVLETANERAEYYARIDPTYIRVLKPEAIDGLPKTDKGTVIRAAFYKKYADLIETIYEDAQHIDLGNLQDLNITEMKDWLLQTLGSILRIGGERSISVDTDFFAIGLDSVSAYRVYGLIVKTLDLGGNASKVPANVCFEYPTVDDLAQYLVDLRTGETLQRASEVEVMQQLIDKYGTFQTCAGAAPARRVPKVVLLTGVTGSLGAHILGKLLNQRNIEKVYCLNRASGNESAASRTASALATRNIELDPTRVVSYAANISQSNFGLAHEVYEKLQSEVDLIIHSAWSVNFNMGVSSFEDQIMGVRKLLDFCSFNGAQFGFVSSVSAAVRSGNPVREASPLNLLNAQEMGYARSKLVAETLCQRAHDIAKVHACVFRVGQIIADTQQGQWNETEAIPLMIRSAMVIGALPALDDTLAWLPTDIVAQAMIELSQDDSGSPTGVFHVVNPRTFNWKTDFLPMLRNAGLDFKIVSQHEWLDLLRASESNPEINPTIKLLDFFTNKYGAPIKTQPPIVFETGHAEAKSSTLRSVQAPDQDLITKMLRYWQLNSWNSCTKNSS